MVIMNIRDGCLIQLMASGVQDQKLGGILSAGSAKIFPFSGNTITIYKEKEPFCDGFIPEYVHSKQRATKLTLIVHTANYATKIVDFPLDFCNLLCQFTQPVETQGFLYKLPWRLLDIDPIPIYGKIECVLETSEPSDQNFIIGTCIFLRNRIPEQTIFIPSFCESPVFSGGDVSIELKLNDCHKGIFIESVDEEVDLDEIHSLSLVLNDHLRVKYDHLLLQLFTKRIGPYCLYLPFDNLPFHDKSYSGCINFSRLDNAVLNLQCTKTFNLRIRAISHDHVLFSMHDVQRRFAGAVWGRDE